MRLIPIKSLTDIYENDTLLVVGIHQEGPEMQMHTVHRVKVSQNDGTEIILKKRGNVYFNLGMYLAGKSWVKQVKKLVLDPEQTGMKIDFDGLRRNMVESYNSLAESLNTVVEEGNDTFSPDCVQGPINDLREGIGWLICLEEPGEFSSLNLDLVTFNPNENSGY